MLGNFENETDRVALNLESIEDVGQVTLELNVNDGTDNLSNGSDGSLLGSTSLGSERASGSNGRHGEKGSRGAQAKVAHGDESAAEAVATDGEAASSQSCTSNLTPEHSTTRQRQI
jgi:hypothetical protein